MPSAAGQARLLSIIVFFRVYKVAESTTAASLVMASGCGGLPDLVQHGI